MMIKICNDGTILLKYLMICFFSNANIYFEQNGFRVYSFSEDIATELKTKVEPDSKAKTVKREINHFLMQKYCLKNDKCSQKLIIKFYFQCKNKKTKNNIFGLLNDAAQASTKRNLSDTVVPPSLTNEERTIVERFLKDRHCCHVSGKKIFIFKHEPFWICFSIFIMKLTAQRLDDKDKPAGRQAGNWWQRMFCRWRCSYHKQQAPKDSTSVEREKGRFVGNWWQRFWHRIKIKYAKE